MIITCSQGDQTFPVGTDTLKPAQHVAQTVEKTRWFICKVEG